MTGDTSDGMVEEGLLAVVSTREGALGVVGLDGELDVGSAPILTHCLDELIDAGVERIELDCSRLTFVDSMGLSAVLAAWKRMQGRSVRPVVMVRTTPAVDRVLRVAGLDEVLLGG